MQSLKKIRKVLRRSFLILCNIYHLLLNFLNFYLFKKSSSASVKLSFSRLKIPHIKQFSAKNCKIAFFGSHIVYIVLLSFPSAPIICIVGKELLKPLIFLADWSCFGQCFNELLKVNLIRTQNSTQFKFFCISLNCILNKTCFF